MEKKKTFFGILKIKWKMCNYIDATHALEVFFFKKIEKRKFKKKIKIQKGQIKMPTLRGFICDIFFFKSF